MGGGRPEVERRQYEVRFRLGFSARPWATAPKHERVISGTRGLLWHAEWLLGPQDVRPADLWRGLRSAVRELLVHLIFDGSSLRATFAAVDDTDAIADAIGHVFDDLIMTRRPMPPLEPGQSLEELGTAWRGGADDLPPKVQVASALATFDPYNPDAFSIFSA
jgi:hypothetical protein